MAAFLNADDMSKVIFALFVVGLFGAAYFVHAASLAWIEIAKDGTKLSGIPSWYGRKLWDEAELSAQIGADSELLVCRRFAHGAFDSFYLIVRTLGTADKIIWRGGNGVSRRYWEKTAGTIVERYHLNVRLIVQRSDGGSTEERAWTEDSHKRRWKNFKLLVGPMLTPWLGIAVRLMTHDRWTIVALGAFFWVAVIVCFFLFYHFRQLAKLQNFGTFALFWTVQFLLIYSIAVLATGTYLNR